MAAASAPAQGSGRGILDGVRVIDMTSILFGAYSTQMLGDLGADVIKIEAPGRKGGDFLRYAGKPQVSRGMGPLFQHYNRNKRSVLLDAADPEDKAALIELLRSADMFVTNVRMKGLLKLGLGYEAVCEINPEIVYVHCVGYGSDGPYAELQAYDDLIQAATGAADLLPRLDGDPSPRFIPSQIVDKSSGLFGTIAALAALMHKRQSGEGQFVEVPMMECFASFNMAENLYGHTFVPPTGSIGYSRVFNPRRRPLKTKDGYLAVLAHTDESWEIFFDLAGLPQSAYSENPRFATPELRRENRAAIYALIDEAALAHSADDWVALLSARNVPSMKARRLEEVVNDPHLVATDFFEHREHPTEGEYLSMRHPVRYGKTPATIRYDAPRLGEHTDEVLAEVGIVRGTPAGDKA